MILYFQNYTWHCAHPTFRSYGQFVNGKPYYIALPPRRDPEIKHHLVQNAIIFESTYLGTNYVLVKADL